MQGGYSGIVCPACGVPFSSPALLENHQRRFCVNSRVDREAANIISQLGGGPQGNAQQGDAFQYPAMGKNAVVPSAPPRQYYPQYRGGNAGALPSVDFELFQLIKTQQQQLALMQGMMNMQVNGHGNISPRGQPWGGYGGGYPPAWEGGGGGGYGGIVPPVPQMAPLASTTGESSLTEGRYGLQLFAVEGLDQVLSCPPEDVSVVIREYVASLDSQKPTPRGGGRGGMGRAPPAPSLFLDARGGEHVFDQGCIVPPRQSRNGRRSQGMKLKKVEVSFSILQHRELHVFVIELYALDGRLLAWTEVAVDALGEKARPLRSGPVEAGLALKTPNLRVLPGGLIGLETFRTSWKQQQHHSKGRRHSPVSSAEPSDEEEDSQRREEAPKRRASQPPVATQHPAEPQVQRRQSQKPDATNVPKPTPTEEDDPLNIQSSGPGAKRRDSVPNSANSVHSTRPTSTESTTVRVGRGPQRDAGKLGVDSVVGVPTNVSCTRVIVYFASAVADGGEVFPLDAPDFFLRVPELIAYQTLDSPTIEPVFHSEMNIVIGKQTTAVAIVECIDPKKGRFTLGHAVLPLNQEFNAGNYMSRLLIGDPRPSHLRTAEPKSVEEDAKHQADLARYDTAQLNLSLLSRELKDALRASAPSNDSSRYWPCAYIKWRADANDRNRPYREPVGQLPITPDEATLQKERQRVVTRTPSTMDVTTQEKCASLFAQKWVPVDDSVAYVAPYNPSRGIFMKVECLRGMTTERCLYKVLVETSVEGGEKLSHFTQQHDFDSDIGVPEFLDEPFVFPRVPYSLTGVAVFRVFKMLDPSVENPGGIMPVAWSATKLFLEDGVVRHGRFSIPMFSGTPPSKLLDELKSERIDQVILKWSSNPPSGQQKIDYLKPRSLITLCQGDAARSNELVKQQDPFRTDPRLLLIPTRLRKDFPFQDDEGYQEELLGTIIEEGKSPSVFQDAMNKQLKKYFKKL